MARGRMLSKEISSDEKVNALSSKSKEENNGCSKNTKRDEDPDKYIKGKYVHMVCR